MAEQTLMKDGLGPEAVSRMAGVLKKLDPEIAVRRFRNRANKGLDQLELKDRVRHLITVLHEFLPADFVEAARLLSRLQANWPEGDPNDPLRSFAAWPFIDYVAEYGIDHPETALPLLRKLTGLFSAEFAIRPFIINHHKVSYRHLQAWIHDDDYHVRRLVSEGTRPRLPWGQRLPGFCKDPSPVLALLEQLKDDVSESVRRSVANNLNDIAKDNPDQVISTCRRWKKNASSERQWIIRHATRSLVKSGHPGIFGLLGFTVNPMVNIEQMKLERGRIKLGESLAFSAQVISSSQQKQKLVIDYAIHHVKANGARKPKVFKLGEKTLAPGESITVSKTHAIRLITTRKYYAGVHAVELLINGKPSGSLEFELKL